MMMMMMMHFVMVYLVIITWTCVCVCAAAKLPYGLLDSGASSVLGGLDASSLEKQLALSAAFGGAAGLAALTGASERVEVYSRKVFVGGLPPDIDEGIYCILSTPSLLVGSFGM